MKLTRALVSCDLNKHYLDFWPIVYFAWKHIVGIECTLVLIAEEIPEDLLFKENVVLFKPIDGINTIFTAQCIRLLYPCLLEGEEGIIISDIDMIPLDKKYFIETIKDLDNNIFFSYRGIHHKEKQIFICYNVASATTYQDVFTVKSAEDIILLLKLWNTWVRYEGRHSGEGWFADQLILYDAIINWEYYSSRFSSKTDEELSFRHLDRSENNWINLNSQLKTELKYGYYKDFHMPTWEICQGNIINIYNYMINLRYESPAGQLGE